MTIGINLGNILSVGVTVGSTAPAPPPAPTSSTPSVNTPVPDANMVREQMLIPIRDINGAVVRWSLQTIEYDKRLTTPAGRPANYAPLAPWMVSYKVISVP